MIAEENIITIQNPILVLTCYVLQWMRLQKLDPHFLATLQHFNSTSLVLITLGNLLDVAELFCQLVQELFILCGETHFLRFATMPQRHNILESDTRG